MREIFNLNSYIILFYVMILGVIIKFSFICNLIFLCIFFIIEEIMMVMIFS